MTASQLASMLRARKTGKDRWMAKCPAHPDRQPSLAIAEGRKGIVIRCMSQGCETRDILNALGLSWADLFRGQPSAQVLARVTDEILLDVLEKRLGLMDMLIVSEPQKKHYWAAAIERTEQEIIRLRRRIYPDDRLPIRFRGQSRYGRQLPGGSWSRQHDSMNKSWGGTL
jgi:hypothetical protein